MHPNTVNSHKQFTPLGEEMYLPSFETRRSHTLGQLLFLSVRLNNFFTSALPRWKMFPVNALVISDWMGFTESCPDIEMSK